MKANGVYISSQRSKCPSRCDPKPKSVTATGFIKALETRLKSLKSPQLFLWQKVGHEVSNQASLACGGHGSQLPDWSPGPLLRRPADRSCQPHPTAPQESTGPRMHPQAHSHLLPALPQCLPKGPPPTLLGPHRRAVPLSALRAPFLS